MELKFRDGENGIMFQPPTCVKCEYLTRQLAEAKDERETENILLGKLAAADFEIARLRKALDRLSRPLACGCLPCIGDCRSQVALETELEGRIDFAKQALEANDGMGTITT